MTTRDTMELKEEAIRAQYEAALGMVLGFDVIRWDAGGNQHWQLNDTRNDRQLGCGTHQQMGVDFGRTNTNCSIDHVHWTNR